MRRSLALTGFAILALSTSSTRADDRPLLQRIAERTPQPLRPVEHTAARAGYPLSVKPHAIPSVTRFDHGGYVGGASLRNNDLFASGPGSAPGATQYGTYGTDFGGFRAHLGRVFLASSNDPARGHPAYLAYRSDGPRITDVLALRPLRKAVLEKREQIEERKHEKEGHAPKDGEAKGGGH